MKSFKVSQVMNSCFPYEFLTANLCNSTADLLSLTMSEPSMKPEQLESDEQLVRNIFDNDEYAFKQLYFKYYELLYKFVWHRIHADDDAKDLLQTLFIRLWNNREKLDPNQSIKAYLYRIAANLLTDYFRQKGENKDIPSGRI